MIAEMADETCDQCGGEMRRATVKVFTNEAESNSLIIKLEHVERVEFKFDDGTETFLVDKEAQDFIARHPDLLDAMNGPQEVWGERSH